MDGVELVSLTLTLCGPSLFGIAPRLVRRLAQFDNDMKIIHATSVHRPLDTRIFWKECVSLAEAGHDVTLVAPHDAPLEPLQGVSFITVPQPRNRLARFLFMPLRLFRHMWANKDGISHVHDPDLLPMAVLLRLCGRKVVYDMHEDLPLQIQHKDWIAPWLRGPIAFVWRLFERIAYRVVPVVLGAKNCTHDYQWVAPSKKANVYNFPVVEKWVDLPRKPAKKPVVAYIGGLSYDRATDVLMDAIDILEREGKCPRFELIGPSTPDDLIPRYRKRIAAAGLSDKVVFHGFVRNDEAMAKIVDARIGIAILRPMPNYLNTFPTKMLEYMALSMPIITSDFPLNSNIAQEHACGLAVDPESAQAVADAIRYLLEHQDEAEKMGDNGRKAVKAHYSWASQFQNLLGLYDRVMTGKA